MTPLLLVKVLRDLWTARARFALMIVALAVSLTAFGAVLATRAIVGRETAASYLSTNPASATLVLERGLTAQQFAAIRTAVVAQPGIVDAALRDVVTAQMRSADGEWAADPFQLFIAAPADPMRVATFRPQSGAFETVVVDHGKMQPASFPAPPGSAAWPPPAGSVLVERSTLASLHLAVGQTIVVKIPNGTAAALRIAGVVHDPSVPPSYEEQKGYGYISSAGLPLLGAKNTLDELKIVVADRPGDTTPSHSRDTIVRVASNLALWLAQTHGIHVEQIQVPAPYQHPHQGQMNVVLIGLLGFAVMALLLSAILVAVMLNGILTQQIPQIGILKAIGARSSRIFAMYLLMLLLVAAAATCIALPPSMALARMGSRMLLVAILNMDPTSLATPTWVVAAVILAGLLLPPLIALVPLVSASRTTVRAAIDYQGIDRNALAGNPIGAWFGSLRGIDRTILLGVRNVFRRRARFWMSLGLLGFAGALFMTGMNAAQSIAALSTASADEQRWDVDVLLSNATASGPLARAVNGIPHVTAVETWSQLPTGLQRSGHIEVSQTYPDQGHGSTNVFVLPPGGSALLKTPRVTEGRWLRPDDTGVVVLNQVARANIAPNVHPGGTVTLSVEGRPTTWRVVGIVEELSAGANVFVAGGAGRANLLRIATNQHDAGTRNAVAQAAEHALALASVDVQYARPSNWQTAVAGGHEFVLIAVVLAIAGITALVGLIGLGSSMSSNVLERTREFGVMQAIGARATAVYSVVLSEGIFTALASCIPATLLAFVLTPVVDRNIGNMMFHASLPLRVSPAAIAIWTAAVVLGAVVATLAPAFRASRITVREALAYV